MVSVDHIPSEVELMALSHQIDHQIAEQILKYSEEWSLGEIRQRLDIINQLIELVDSLGKHAW